MHDTSRYRPARPSDTPVYDAVVRELGEPWVPEIRPGDLVDYEEHLGYLPRQRTAY